MQTLKQWKESVDADTLVQLSVSVKVGEPCIITESYMTDVTQDTV